MQQSPMNLLTKAASLRITCGGITALMIGVLITYFREGASWIWTVAPLILLAINLIAAMSVDPRLYGRFGLLVFHVSLLTLVLLIAYGRLSTFHGRVEIMEGQVFDAGAVQVIYAGPLHSVSDLSDVSFLQRDILVEYAPEIVRKKTISRVQSEMLEVEKTFGDNVPFQVGEYEFYTTSNKGFATLLTWIPKTGSVLQGVVYFPSFPLNEWNQTNEWISPGGQGYRLELTGLPVLDDSTAFSLNRDTVNQPRLRVVDPVETVLLSSGDEIERGTEKLRLDDVRLWIGYEIRSDPTTTWTFFAAFAGILGIGWHFVSGSRILKMSSRKDVRATALQPEFGSADV